MFTQFDWPDEDYSRNSIPFSMNGAHLDVWLGKMLWQGRTILVSHLPSLRLTERPQHLTLVFDGT
jgi:hypothetical protein